MEWTQKFDLFLFDFDGLLVDTEKLHYLAYLDVLEKRNLKTSLGLSQFFSLAHASASAWKEALCADVPELGKDWEAVYQDKKEAFLDRIYHQKVELMPGVKELLKLLEKEKKRRCVVTHSGLDFVKNIRAKEPLLDSLPHWITREDYEKPKPDPECYLKAIALHSQKGDRIVGFEDSLRGFRSLKQTSALPVLICPKHHPLLEIALQDGGIHFESFHQVKFSK